MRGIIYLLIALFLISTVCASDVNNSNSSTVCGDGKRAIPQEECDPPAEACYTEDYKEGFCNDDCKCIEFSGHSICGNDLKEPEEECEKDSHCSDSKICDDCSCIEVIETITEINQTETNQTEETTIEIEETEPEVQPSITEEDLEREKFNETIGIKITSGISKIANALFGWIIRLIW